MTYKLIDPLQGTKIVIEGPFAKSGKTLLAVSMLLAKLDKHPELIAYGNIWIDHPQYEQKKAIKPSDFEEKHQYVILIDELDINFAWQSSYDNEGLLAFWGKGASHGRCAVIATIQRAYRELDLKLLRQFHITLELLLKSRKVPYAVAGYTYGVFQSTFYQNIENAIGNYDEYGEAERLFLWGFKAESDRNYLDKLNDNNKNRKKKQRLFCISCGHRWTPKTAHPLTCPMCKKRFGFGVAE